MKKHLSKKIKFENGFGAVLYTFPAMFLLVICGCGQNELEDAVIHDDARVVASLLRNGADPNHQDAHGSTPLHFSRSRGVASQLILAGADVNSRTDNGNTPLHAAAAFGNYDVAEILVTNGADVNARNNDGSTPLHWAVSELIDEAGFADSFYIKKKGVAVNYHDKYVMADYLLNNGANPNIKAVNSESPLHRASASWDDSKYIDLLIIHGADTKAIGPNGWTPLQYAEKSGHQDAVNRLEKE